MISAGSIAANVDLANNFSTWYNKTFLEESGKVSAALATDLVVAVKKVENFVLESMGNASSSIERLGDNQIAETKNEIEKYLNENQQQLDQTVRNLENENFDNYATTRNIEQEIELDFKDLLEQVLSE